MKKLKWKICGLFEWVYSRKAIRLISKCEDFSNPDDYGRKLEKCIDRMWFWSFRKYSMKY